MEIFEPKVMLKLFIIPLVYYFVLQTEEHTDIQSLRFASPKSVSITCV
jgi:hypothetical protein